MTLRSEAVSFELVESVVLTKIDAATGRIDEVIESTPGAPSRVLLRRGGAAAESYARLENVMIAMRMRTSGNTGAAEYAAGEDVEVDIEHARRVFLLDHGDVLDQPGGKKLTPVKAAAALALRADDIATAVPALRRSLAKYKEA